MRCLVEPVSDLRAIGAASASTLGRLSRASVPVPETSARGECPRRTDEAPVGTDDDPVGQTTIQWDRRRSRRSSGTDDDPVGQTTIPRCGRDSAGRTDDDSEVRADRRRLRGGFCAIGAVQRRLSSECPRVGSPRVRGGQTTIQRDRRRSRGGHDDPGGQAGQTTIPGAPGRGTGADRRRFQGNEPFHRAEGETSGRWLRSGWGPRLPTLESTAQSRRTGPRSPRNRRSFSFDPRAIVAGVGSSTRGECPRRTDEDPVDERDPVGQTTIPRWDRRRFGAVQTS